MRGCHSSFYLHRCLACERQIPRNAEHQKVCHRSECKRAWRLKTIQSRFLGWDSGSDSTPLETSIKPGLPEAVKAGRGWRIVTGETSPSGFHCGIVPDGPGWQWKDGQFKRIEAANRAALKAHFAKLEATEIAANSELTDPEWREVISPDGVRCFVTTSTPDVKVIMKPITVEISAGLSIPDDLSIPEFLRRK
jgi:hypothetical protein